MRVLDLGCGGGDVSFLAAEMVGGEGSVLGVDRGAPAVEKACQKARERGISNVNFVCAALDDLHFPDSFDAVVGRLILCHLPDPVLAVRQAALQVRRGGLVIFHEGD
jgi:2-polyprenyl-3-methyl-5-hydroxy-6-metoxy-1,4-benzoquinol methylase